MPSIGADSTSFTSASIAVSAFLAIMRPPPSVEPARAPDLAPERERLRELCLDLRPRLRAPMRVQHHAHNAVDAEPGRPEASVVHFEITASRAKRILAVRRALAAPALDSSQRRARWCTSGRASSNRTSMAGLPSWRMVNLA